MAHGGQDWSEVKHEEGLVERVQETISEGGATTGMTEDMVQEAFLKAYRLIKGFRGDARFSTWMYRVTSSVCLTELNRRKRRNETALEPSHMEQQTVDGPSEVELPLDCPGEELV